MKALKKKLRKYGFEREFKHTLIFEANNYYFCMNLALNEFFTSINLNRCAIKDPTFAQIAEKVLELTGVTLTPKQTKRQEIATLRESVKLLDKENHELGISVAKNEKDIKKFNRNAEENRLATLAAIDSLKERVEVLEKDKAFLGRRKPLFFGMDFGTGTSYTASIKTAVDGLINEEINKCMAKPFKFHVPLLGVFPSIFRDVDLTAKESEPKKYGFIKNADSRCNWSAGDRIEIVAESSIGATVKLVHHSKGDTFFYKYTDLTLDSEEPKKEAPKSEPVKTEGVFEVGDSVVLNKNRNWMNKARTDANNGVVFVIRELIGKDKAAVALPSKLLKFRTFFTHSLQHAPKGSTKANSVNVEDYQKAYRYACDLLTTLDEKHYGGGVIPLESIEGVISQIDNVAAGLERRERRKEAAKVLEFGKECKLGIVSEAAEDAGYFEGDTVIYLGKGKGVHMARYMKEGHEVRGTGVENLKPL